MDTPSIRILMIEDNPGDARLVREILSEEVASKFVLEHAANMAQGLEKLGGEEWDVVLSDLNLPDSKGLETFTSLSTKAPALPLIILSGFNDENFALEAVKNGAQDYLVKGQFDRHVLVRTILYAIERKKLIHMRDEFVNMVSHELRNPLAVLKEALVQFHEGTEHLLKKDTLELLEIAMRSVDRLARTTNELLELAKMEAGKTEFEKTPFNLTALIHEMTSFFHSRISLKGLTFHKNLPAHEIYVIADRDKIAEVLTNLLTNALKFTSTGSIEVSPSDFPDHVECSVCDTGTGIADENLPKIFSKFEQFGKKMASVEKGTGLGLAICKEIIERHQGKIWVESKYGCGSKFIFTLPKP
jgi:signal transduction histidine kinase